MKLRFVFLSLLVPSMFVPICKAQSVTATEMYGPVTAAQVYDSLGTNISPDQEWEYQAAQAAHITWGRFDCSWQVTELQRLPQNISGGYTLPKQCASGLAYGKIYGVHSMLDALYGAPYGKIATAVTTTDSGPGSTLIPLRITSGSLSDLIPGQSYLRFGNGSISGKHAYAGTLIASKSGNSVTLASALTTELPAGSSVILNLQLYAPVLISPSTNYLSNPSVQAYENYVHFLQTQVAASGFPGRVSLWNEPPWFNEPWDDAANLYDNPVPENRISPKVGIELAYAALALPPMPSAMLDNGYTNKSGSGSVFHPARLSNLISPRAASGVFASESFHPYGNNPEDAAWNPSCVQAHSSPAMLGKVFQDCTPLGTLVGSNTKWQAAFNASHDGFHGIDLGITETNLDRGGKKNATETQISRFDLRQFLVFAGSGVHPILFYRLAADSTFGWLRANHSPYPVYTAFQAVMANMQKIAQLPVAPYPACSNPAVQAYAGRYPLATVLLVGSRPGDHSNSLIFYTWQRSYSSGSWVALPSPETATVSVAIPYGLKVDSVRNTVSSSPIDFKVNGSTLSYPVADDPIEISMFPVSSAVVQKTCK